MFSICGDGFVFTRQKVGEELKHSYAPDYLIESLDCGGEVETSIDYQDYVADLNVGVEYEYCVAAFDKQYMVNRTVDDGSFVRTSDPSCVAHRVIWEASAVVKVTTIKGAGSMAGESEQSISLCKFDSADF